MLRNPSARDAPIDLRAPTKAAAHVADAFVALQAARMEAGAGEDEAYAFAEGVLGAGEGREVGEVLEGGEDGVFHASLRDARRDIEMREMLGAVGEEEDGRREGEEGEGDEGNGGRR